MEIKIHDQTLSGDILNEILIKIEKEVVTIKDVIEQRVIQEVEKYNMTIGNYFTGLVQPSESENTLNGFKMQARKKIDPEKQVYIALKAFETNGYFVLVNDEQVESLNEEILFDDSTTISFLKLTPLVGG